MEEVSTPFYSHIDSTTDYCPIMDLKDLRLKLEYFSDFNLLMNSLPKYLFAG